MCFSSEASFTGGVIISAIGTAVLTRVHKPSQILFACIPLFFGLQQFTEGFLWLTIPRPEYGNELKFLTVLYLAMADVLWPLIIPLSVLFMEENIKKRKILRIFLIAGLLVSSYYTICLFNFQVKPQIMGYHLFYNTGFPESMAIPALIIYLLATLPPLFVSSVQKTKLLGILMFLSCLVTAVFFTRFLTSVWCFFAALISGVIFWILCDSKRKFRFDKISLANNQ